MALTTEQQEVIDDIQANFTAFMTALVEALEVDNDRESTLDVAGPKREALAAAFQAFHGNNLSGFIRKSDGSAFLMRYLARDENQDGINLGDPTWTIPRL